MATGTTTVASDATTATVSGSGSGILCSLHLGANERAALVEAYAIEASGDMLHPRAIVAVDPDSGELQLTGDPTLFAVDVTDNNRLDFKVGDSGSWRGFVRLTITGDYSV